MGRSAERGRGVGRPSQGIAAGEALIGSLTLDAVGAVTALAFVATGAVDSVSSEVEAALRRFDRSAMSRCWPGATAGDRFSSPVPSRPCEFVLRVGRSGTRRGPGQMDRALRSGIGTGCSGAGGLDIFVAGDVALPFVGREISANDVAGTLHPPLGVERDLEQSTRGELPAAESRRSIEHVAPRNRRDVRHDRWVSTDSAMRWCMVGVWHVPIST